MPTISKVSVTYGRKFNLGDYNSSNLEMSVSAELEEGEDLDAVMKGLWGMVRTNVKAQAMPLVAKHKVDIEEVYMGLTVETRKAITGGSE